MKYEDLYVDFKALFPEDLPFFVEREKETGTGSDDGMHVVFGMNVVPFVKKIVLESSEKAKKAFAFFEEMEKSGDSKIAEVLEFSVLEELLTEDKSMVDVYAEFFGEETREAAMAVGKWFK